MFSPTSIGSHLPNSAVLPEIKGYLAYWEQTMLWGPLPKWHCWGDIFKHQSCNRRLCHLWPWALDSLNTHVPYLHRSASTCTCWVLEIKQSVGQTRSPCPWTTRTCPSTSEPSYCPYVDYVYLYHGPVVDDRVLEVWRRVPFSSLSTLSFINPIPTLPTQIWISFFF